MALDKVEKKYTIIIGLGIFLISSGAYLLLNYAVGPLLQANQLVQNPTCDNDILACNSLPVYLTLTDEHGNIISLIKGQFNVTSKTSFFINNRINYTTQVNVIGIKKVSRIFFILSPKDVDISKINQKTPSELLTQAKNDQELIELQPHTDNQFYRSGYWIPVSQIDVVLVAVVVFDDNTASSAEKSPVLVSIGSQKEKSDAEQSQESRITNKIILALTWIGIGLAPMFAGSDMILRVVFKS